MEQVSIIGIDVAKRSFQLRGARVDGSVAFRKRLSREKPLHFLGFQPRCVVAMEACASAHYWGRVTTAEITAEVDRLIDVGALDGLEFEDGDSTRQSAAASLLQIGAPAAVLGNVAMPAFGHRAWVEDGLDAPAVRKRDLPPVEVRRLSGFDACPQLVVHQVQFSLHRDAARAHLEHAWMVVVNGIHAIGRRRLSLPQKLCPLEIFVEFQPPHQRSVDEQLKRHRILLLLHRGCSETPGKSHAIHGGDGVSIRRSRVSIDFVARHVVHRVSDDGEIDDITDGAGRFGSNIGSSCIAKHRPRHARDRV